MSRVTFIKPVIIAFSALLLPSLLPAKPLSEKKTNISASANFVFLENKGQIIDEQNLQRGDIDVKLEIPGLNIFIGKAAIHYQWLKYDGPETGDKKANSSRPVHMYRMDAILVGANLNAELIKEQQQPYIENYFLPQCPSGTVAHSYEKVVYKNIYPNIDWVLYAKNNSLKYEFIVHPGGRASDIKIKYDGADDLKITDGALTITTPQGSITEQNPFSYDAVTKKEIASSFVLKNNVLSFDIGTAANNFIIDPVLNWATYYGTSSPSCVIEAVASDTSGNVYATGFSANVNNIATFLSYQYTYAGGNGDAILIKFNASGQRWWATYFGSSDYDEGMAINYCTTGGCIYMSGITYGTSGIASTGAYQTTNGGNPFNGQSAADCFLAKFDINGNRIWSTYYGGTGLDFAGYVCSDDMGNVFISGETQSPNAMATPGAFRTTQDINFIAKFNASGVRQWGTYYAGAIRAMTCDRYKNLYIGGLTPSYNNIADSPTYQLYHGGGYNDGFLAKFDSAGARKWGSYYGGIGEDCVRALACDYWGNLYVAGETTSPDSASMVTPGSFKTKYSPSAYYATTNCTNYNREDGFLAKFNAATCTRIWGTYYGDTCSDIFYSIALDSSGRSVWLTGTTLSTRAIATANGYRTSPSLPFPIPANPPLGAGCTPMGSQGIPPPNDAFFVKFDYRGKRQYGTYYGGNDGEFYMTISYGGSRIYFGGTTFSDNNIATAGSYQSSVPPPPGSSAIQYGFIAQFSADTAVYLRKLVFTDTLLCQGDVKRLDYGTIGSFRSGNNFIVQLSDSAGSFSSPLNIGTSIATTTGFVNYTIPVNTIPAGKYRIRLISTAPSDTTFDNGINIRVSDYPNPIANALTPVCAGSALPLYDNGTSPVSTKYLWTGPNGMSAGFKNYNRPNVQMSDTGYYLLTANNYGCIKKDSVHVGNILPAPNTISITSNSPVCEGDTLKVHAGTSTSPVTWFWQKPAGYFPNTGPDTVIYAASLSDAGTYKAQAVYNGCPSNFDSIVVTVNPKLTPTMQVKTDPGTTNLPGTLLTFSAINISNEGSNPTWQWFKNGIYITGATNMIYQGIMSIDIHSGDSVCLQMTSSADCASPRTISSCSGLLLDIGVHNPPAINTISVYPNPNDGRFVFRSAKNGALYISNIQGQQITEQKIQAGKTNISLSTHFVAGIYIGKFIDADNNVSMFRIVLDK